MRTWEDQLTENEKRAAGLTTDQKRDRFARQAKLLGRLGLGDTREACALKNADARIQKQHG